MEKSLTGIMQILASFIILKKEAVAAGVSITDYY